jgi:hypothetical protein
MRVLRGLVASVFLWAVISGCNTQAKWTYPVEPKELYSSNGHSSGAVVAVLPFQEQRPVLNRAATFLLYLIPLVPFGWVTYNRPEAARMFNTIAKYDFNVDEDLGKAATRSFTDSKLFRRVYFTLGGETAEADFTLQGVAERTTYEGKIISYGLSFAGAYLWFLGLPAGTSTDILEVSLSLNTRDGQQVWNYTFKGSDSITQGLYYNWGDDTLAFATLMQTGMNDALKDLAAKLPAIVSQANTTKQPAEPSSDR